MKYLLLFFLLTSIGCMDEGLVRTVKYTISVKNCTLNTWDTIIYEGSNNPNFHLYTERNRFKLTHLVADNSFIASNVCLFQILNREYEEVKKEKTP